MADTSKYNKKAGKYIQAIYKAAKAHTWEQKYNALVKALDIVVEDNEYTRAISFKWRAIALEFEILERDGLITPKAG